MKYIDGKSFHRISTDTMIDFLKNRNISNYTVNPSSLKIIPDANSLILKLTNGKVSQFPVRRCFLYKLLSWFNFPLNQLEKLSVDSISGICNDFLLNIKSEVVNIKLENHEALSITGKMYTEINDLDIIEKFKHEKITHISRNDFVTRFYYKEKYKIEPIPGDIFGYGFNILNSETGFHSLSFNHFLYRYSCSNGAFIKLNRSVKSLIHYKNSAEKLIGFIDSNIKDLETAKKIVSQAIALANITNISGLFEEIRLKVNRVIGREKTKIFFNGFGEETNKFELFNYITDKAKSYDLHKRMRLESIAGELLMN